MDDNVQVFGVQPNGETKLLGAALMPPKMKARELAREQFGHFEEGDGSEADMCHYALEQMAEHCAKFHAGGHFKPI